MFLFALLTGIYSYVLFFLGILGWLYRPVVVVVTVGWVVLCVYICVSKKVRSETVEQRSNKSKVSRDSSDALLRFYQSLRSFQNDNKRKITRKNWVFLLFLFLIIAQLVVNLVGALGPEFAFDALWYHLTLPKMFLSHHAVYHIGGQLYYSDMPKLGEMLYTGMLSLGSEIWAKVLHYFFGVLMLIALYLFSRMFFTRTLSLLCVVIMAANLVFDWEQITAYIDLIRTFYELLALWGLFVWMEKGEKKWWYLSAVMMGMAVTTKVLALGSVVIVVFLMLLVKNLTGDGRREMGARLKEICMYVLIALVVPLPWFIFSFIHTGNPVYPFFSSVYGISPTNGSPIYFVISIVKLFTQADDPISPVYLIFLPLIIFYIKKFSPQVKLLVWYAGLGVLVWYFTPQTGGGRFILPYLPVFSMLCVAVLEQLVKQKRKSLYIYCVALVCIVSVISIGYRAVANAKYLPVITGRESKGEFLTKYLNFAYGDFYDTDGYFASHIKPDDKVLLVGFHNMYYVDFPFIDASWRKPDDRFNYVAVQNTELPAEFSDWQLVYANPRTLVELYRRPNLALGIQ